MVENKAQPAVVATGAALNYQQLLKSSLTSARKRQETSLRFLVALFGVILLSQLPFSTAGTYQRAAQAMCVLAILTSLILPWLAKQIDRAARALQQPQVNGEMLAVLLIGTLLTPATLIAVFAYPSSYHWLPLLVVTLSFVCLASISDAHPMRMIFLISPVVIATVTSLSWTGESFDLLLSLAMTSAVFATVMWLRQRHRSLMTSLVARVNDQMMPIKLERRISALGHEIENLTLTNRASWLDMEMPAQTITSLAQQLEAAYSGNPNIARNLVRISNHLSAQILQHGGSAGTADIAHSSNLEWVSINSLFETVRLRLIAQTQSSGARLQFNSVAADVEALPGLTERIVQNLVVHSIIEANASSVSVSARFVGQTLSISVEHNGLPPLPDLSRPDLLREGLPRALALTSTAELPLDIATEKRTGFTLTFDQWRKQAPRSILHPRDIVTRSNSGDSGAKCRALLIDDDPLARMGLAALLEHAGYDTTIWSGQSTESIKSELTKTNFDFIVSDWWLGQNANAIAMLKWVQQNLPAPVPVLIVSGDSGLQDASVIAAQLDHIALRTVSKPVTPKTLARAISDLRELDQNCDSPGS